MREEETIRKFTRNENPFNVPAGYFDQLTGQVMTRLPEKKTPAPLTKTPTKWERIKPWAYMAAMFVGAAVIIRVASFNHSDNLPQVVVNEMDTENLSDEYIWNVVNESMMDDYSLYVYLTENSVE